MKEKLDPMTSRQVANVLSRASHMPIDEAVGMLLSILDSDVELTWSDEEALEMTLDYLRAIKRHDARRLEDVHGIYLEEVCR